MSKKLTKTSLLFKLIYINLNFNEIKQDIFQKQKLKGYSVFLKNVQLKNLLQTTKTVNSLPS